MFLKGKPESALCLWAGEPADTPGEEFLPIHPLHKKENFSYSWLKIKATVSKDLDLFHESASPGLPNFKLAPLTFFIAQILATEGERRQMLGNGLGP
jgi:hypothetical protein